MQMPSPVERERERAIERARTRELIETRRVQGSVLEVSEGIRVRRLGLGLGYGLGLRLGLN
jgi:hypothetical protein